MKVGLLDFTGAGHQNGARHAADILLFTKSTRLDMRASFEDIINLPNDQIADKLKEMANTNPGSWEFIHFTFFIQDVTRGFTHQLVRTRTASYAQQSMRVLKIDKWTYGKGPTIREDDKREAIYDTVMHKIDEGYKELLESGAAIEDARGILPTNIHTNICMTINMRNFINLTRKRVSLRVQKEYRDVMQAMIMEVERVYPWFYIFYKNDEAQARRDLQNLIYDNQNLTSEEKSAMIKKLDIIVSEI